MAEARFDFGLATRLDADAIGEPGQRTFRLLIRSGSSSALIWMEKQQLLALAVAMEQVLAQVAPGEARRAELLASPAAASAQDFPLNPTVEFKVGQLQLGHDAANEQFQIIANDDETAEDGPPTFTVRTGYQAARRLCSQITSVASAGRPLCPLCGEAMGPESHHCPPERIPPHIANGYIH